MVEPVNLRQFRKRKAREDKERAADENRRKHGRSGSDKKQSADVVCNLNKHLDGHLRDPDKDR